MAMSEEKLRELEQSLKQEPDFMSPEDHIEAHVQGDYWNGLFGLSQNRGNYYFTAEKVIFVSGLGINSFAVKYSDIREIKKCMVNMFLPTGIRISAVGKNDKLVKYRMSVMKRGEWLEFLSKKTGLTM